jgi:hypothetical protein
MLKAGQTVRLLLVLAAAAGATLLQRQSTHTFKYRSTTMTQPPAGAGASQTGLNFACTVEVEVHALTASAADLVGGVLTLHDCHMHQFTGSAAVPQPIGHENEAQLEAYPLVFALNTTSGIILRTLITSTEPTWVVNTKRAILSLLQAP